MATDDWVLEAIERSYAKGATLREIQRFIDDHHYEELAVETIKQTLSRLELKNRIELDGERWKVKNKSSQKDALKKLFGD